MTFKWTVIGAGPAGITTIAKLLDHNVNAKDILWLDPNFNVGDFGSKWFAVSGNTKIKSFINYFKSCNSFQYNDLKHSFEMFTLPEEETCKLSLVSDVLKNTSQSFESIVTIKKDWVENLCFKNNYWEIATASSNTFNSEKVVLATGAHPKQLNYDIPHIALNECFDLGLLKKQIAKNDSVAVFGSSHSAVLILKNLVELNTNRIINFYREPFKYALELDDCILYDNTGLKGIAAKWVKAYLLDNSNNSIERYLANENNISQYLKQCNRVIYAIGFDRNNDITISGLDNNYKYDHHTGIIAPGLFGIGIAFPEYVTNKFGVSEYNVGLLKFANYINKIMPIWTNYPNVS